MRSCCIEDTGSVLASSVRISRVIDPWSCEIQRFSVKFGRKKSVKSERKIRFNSDSDAVLSTYIDYSINVSFFEILYACY